MDDISFLILAMNEVFQNISNTYNERGGAVGCVFDGHEYGGTYDRPWLYTKVRLTNDQGVAAYNMR